MQSICNNAKMKQNMSKYTNMQINNMQIFKVLKLIISFIMSNI